MADETTEDNDLPRALTAEELTYAACIFAWPRVWTIRAIQHSLDRAAIRNALKSTSSI